MYVNSPLRVTLYSGNQTSSGVMQKGCWLPLLHLFLDGSLLPMLSEFRNSLWRHVFTLYVSVPVLRRFWSQFVLFGTNSTSLITYHSVIQGCKHWGSQWVLPFRDKLSRQKFQKTSHLLTQETCYIEHHLR